MIITLENTISILSGDFNLNLLNSSNADVSNLISRFNSKFSYSLITKPTRVKGNSATLIDHIWTNDLLKCAQSGIIYANISDHFPTFSVFNLNSPNNSSTLKEIQYRDFNPSNIAEFKHHLSEVCWDLVYAPSDPNVAYNNFISIFKPSFDKFFPLKNKTIKVKHSNKPYITNDIKKLIAAKNFRPKIRRQYS